MKIIAALLIIAAPLAAQQTFNQILVKKANPAASTGRVDFFDNSNTFRVHVEASPTLAQNLTWKFPTMVDNAGDCLVSSGSGQWNPSACGSGGSSGGFGVSASQPMFLYAHFRDDDTAHLYFDFSYDGVNFQSIKMDGSMSSAENRDPSIMYRNGVFYIICSPPASDSAKIQFITTTDLIHFSPIQYIDTKTVLSGTNAAWAPEWFQDPVSGKAYITVGLSTNGGALFHPYFIEVDLSTAAVTASHAVTVNGTSFQHTFDFYNYYDAGTAKYYLFYVDQQNVSTVVQPIVYATATTVLGPYTQAVSGDFAGFTTHSEAPSIMGLPNGCIRIYADTWEDEFANNGRKYTVKYRDACGALPGHDPFTSLQNGPTPINIQAAEHGTIIALTDTPTAGIVTHAQALAHQDSSVGSRFGVGTTQPAFTMTIKSKAASGFLEHNEAATYAADPGSGEYAVWAACGTAPFTCPPPEGGGGKWIQNHTGSGGFGMVQLNNTNVGTGEASIAFTEGAYQFGSVPLAVNGGRALWSMGINNQCFGPKACGTNSGNDWFFVYNRNLGPDLGSGPIGSFPLAISPDTGEVRANFGITFGLGNGSALQSQAYASMDSPSPGMIEIGDGVLGHHNGNLSIGNLYVQGVQATGSDAFGPFWTAGMSSTTNGVGATAYFEYIAGAWHSGLTATLVDKNGFVFHVVNGLVIN